MTQSNKASLDTLHNLPRNTPRWALGIVAILVSTVVGLVTAYTTARPELQKMMEVAAVDRVKQRESESATLQALLDLVKDNSKQITFLGSSLYEAQKELAKLKDRVTVLEKEIDITSRKLRDCEDSLKKGKLKVG